MQCSVPFGDLHCQCYVKNPLNNILMVWSANIEPKLRNISILTAFCSFYNLRAIFGKRKIVLFVKKQNAIFWHPWDPWGQVNSGKKFFWVQTATVVTTSALDSLGYSLDNYYTIFILVSPWPNVWMHCSYDLGECTLQH